DSLDVPVDDSVRDHALEREMEERLGVSLDDCPGLREKCNETYGVGGEASARTNRNREDHIEDMSRGSRAPRSSLPDEDEYEEADQRVKSAVIALSENQNDEGVSAMRIQVSRMYARALRGESGTPPMGLVTLTSDDLEIGRRKSDGDYMHIDGLEQPTVARLNRGVLDGDASAKAEAGTYLQSLDGLREIGDEYNSRVDYHTSVLNGNLDRRWALGWSGDPEKMPARPGRIDPAKRYI